MKRKIIFGLSILFTGCAVSNIALTDTESAGYKYGKSKYKGYSKEMYVQGRTINESSCIKCHKLKNPANYTEEQLNKIIPNMAKKARISDEQREVLMKYYVASGKHS